MILHKSINQSTHNVSCAIFHILPELKKTCLGRIGCFHQVSAAKLCFKAQPGVYNHPKGVGLWMRSILLAISTIHTSVFLLAIQSPYQQVCALYISSYLEKHCFFYTVQLVKCALCIVLGQYKPTTDSGRNIIIAKNRNSNYIIIILSCVSEMHY